MPVSHTDNLFQETALGLDVDIGLWVRLHNNDTAVDYYSTAITGSLGDYTHSAPPGDYSVYTGSAATVPGTPTLRNSHYPVPATSDAVLLDTAQTLTGVKVGNDFRFAGHPYYDVTASTYGAAAFDGATDNSAQFTAALTAATNAGGGKVVVPSGTKCALALGVTGWGSNVGLEFMPGASLTITAPLGGSGWFNPSGVLGSLISMTSDVAAGAITVTLPTGQGASFVAGDMFVIQCTLMIQASVSIQSRELRKVYSVSGDVLTLDAPLVYAYTQAASAQFAHITPVVNVSFEGGLFLNTNPTTNTGSLFTCQMVDRVRARDIAIVNGGGGLHFQDSTDVIVDSPTIDRLPNFLNSFGYAIYADGGTYNMTVNNPHVRDVRHAFTTVYYQVGGLWGGPQFVTINDGVSSQTATGGQAGANWDTHEGSYEITFNNCKATSGDGATEYGFQARCKRVRIVNGFSQFGSSGVHHVTTDADDLEVIGGEFSNATGAGLSAAAAHATFVGVRSHNNVIGLNVLATASDTEVKASTIRDNTNEGVLDNASTRLRLIGNNIPGSATQTKGVFSLSATGIAIGNVMDGYSAAHEFWLPAAGAIIQGNFQGTAVRGTGLSIYGDGFNGAVTLDGSTAFAAFSSLVGSTYTLTRDVFFTNLTVNNGVTLVTAGFRVFVSGLLSNAGSINWDGNAAVGAVAGAAQSAGTFAGGQVGATGVLGAGANGTAAGNPGVGGAGGNGGGSGGNGGGTGGSATASAATQQIHGIPAALLARTQGATALNGGGGGASGGGDGANLGGGGGGGGGIVGVYANALNNTGTISAAGGVGGNGAANNAAGGGGGGGGCLILIYANLIALGTVSVAGGTKGTGLGTATTAFNGGTGTLVQIQA